jgi:hypothetical protein
MSELVPEYRAASREIRYEVSVLNDVINLRVRNDGSELSISTDRRGALTLASDILAAVDTTTDTRADNGSPFTFGN